MNPLMITTRPLRTLHKYESVLFLLLQQFPWMSAQTFYRLPIIIIFFVEYFPGKKCNLFIDRKDLKI